MNPEFPWSISPSSLLGVTVVDCYGDMVCMCGDPKTADLIVAWSRLGSPAELQEERDDFKAYRDRPGTW